MEDTYKQIIYKATVLKIKVKKCTKYQYKLKIIQSTTKVIQIHIYFAGDSLGNKKPKVCVGVDCLQAFPPPPPSSAHNVRSPPYLLSTYISNIDIGRKKP
jgi:hypothetical protein